MFIEVLNFKISSYSSWRFRNFCWSWYYVWQ